MQRRGVFIIGFSALSFVGYLIQYFSTHAGLSYFGAILCATGVFPTIPVTIIWAGGCYPIELSRGVVIAFVGAIGMSFSLTQILHSKLSEETLVELSPLSSTARHLGSSQDTPPPWVRSAWCKSGILSRLPCSLFLSILGSSIMMWHLSRINRQKEEECTARNIDHSQWAQYRELGNESPLWRYELELFHAMPENLNSYTGTRYELTPRYYPQSLFIHTHHDYQTFIGFRTTDERSTNSSVLLLYIPTILSVHECRYLSSSHPRETWVV